MCHPCFQNWFYDLKLGSWNKFLLQLASYELKFSAKGGGRKLSLKCIFSPKSISGVCGAEEGLAIGGSLEWKKKWPEKGVLRVAHTYITFHCECLQTMDQSQFPLIFMCSTSCSTSWQVLMFQNFFQKKWVNFIFPLPYFEFSMKSANKLKQRDKQK